MCITSTVRSSWPGSEPVADMIDSRLMWSESERRLALRCMLGRTGEDWAVCEVSSAAG